ncbi:MAG: hypothetical protein NZ455_16305 [Bacteroidia bacterium]|nr:hypothetical protein [Bacteroidia bacterium]
MSIKQGKARMCIKKLKHQSTVCVRDTQHAVRQCGAVAKHRSVSAVRSSPTRSAAKGHAQKIYSQNKKTAIT